MQSIYHLCALLQLTVSVLHTLLEKTFIIDFVLRDGASLSLLSATNLKCVIKSL